MIQFLYWFTGHLRSIAGIYDILQCDCLVHAMVLVIQTLHAMKKFTGKDLID